MKLSVNTPMNVERWAFNIKLRKLNFAMANVAPLFAYNAQRFGDDNDTAARMHRV